VSLWGAVKSLAADGLRRPLEAFSRAGSKLGQIGETLALPCISVASLGTLRLPGADDTRRAQRTRRPRDPGCGSASGLHMEFHAGGQWIITSHVRAITVEPSATGAPC